jgi:hypothetical protein
VRAVTGPEGHGAAGLRGSDKQNQTHRNDLQKKAHDTSAYIKLCAKPTTPEVVGIKSEIS